MSDPIKSKAELFRLSEKDVNNKWHSTLWGSKLQHITSLGSKWQHSTSSGSKLDFPISRLLFIDIVLFYFDKSPAFFYFYNSAAFLVGVYILSILYGKVHSFLDKGQQFQDLPYFLLLNIKFNEKVSNATFFYQMILKMEIFYSPPHMRIQSDCSEWWITIKYIIVFEI